eukprot:SAG25_NODE_5050_length_709_cov_1.565574_1_plen_124_part_01
MGLLAGAGCWLAVGRPVRLRARYSRTAPNVANQPQPLLRSEVQARWRSAIAADGPAVQMDGPPVPASNSRAAAAAAVATPTGSGGGTDSEQEDVPGMATAPREMDRSACIAELKVWKRANGAPS